MVLKLILSAIFILVGLVGLTGVALSLRSVQTMVSTGVNPLDALGSGRVAAVGEIEAAESTVRAPLSGEVCAGYILTREVKHRTGGTGLGLLVPRWHRKDGHYDLPPLYLADDTGCVRLEFDTDVASWRRSVPDELYSDLRLGIDDRVAFDETSPPPEAVHDVLGDVPDVSSAGAVFGIGSNPHRYTEWRLEPGDRLYVLGRSEDSASEATIRLRIDDDMLVDVDATSRVRWLGLVGIRFLAASAFAGFGFGTALVLL
ncbi:hypothetical protein ATJ93_3766 [Halopiger aswanensis]|uniref:Uncharacterized protein n=2 Tax=Halopiger aswanensis TaxID=148449 RepID=A0A419W0E0_9EURY|nr:hypothetical protein ATJ93_3766 [Halopiger aswanensis]